jgi:5-methylcytosine-specific restriction enzyme A
MPYKNTAYKAFIRSARWQRLRAQHLKQHPLCTRCAAKGKTALASEVHHRIACHDDAHLQMDPSNLESLCAPCHAPMRHDDRRGYSKAIDTDGQPLDPNHPWNKPQAQWKPRGEPQTK